MKAYTATNPAFLKQLMEFGMRQAQRWVQAALSESTAIRRIAL
jgi:hypothetical protein